MKGLKICLILVCLPLLVGAQQKYWIYPKDKMPSKAAFNSFSNDHNTEIVVISNWLNAYSSYLDSCEYVHLINSDDVASIEPIRTLVDASYNSDFNLYQISKALDQIHADTIIRLGLDGKGVKIGVIDAGFLDANKDSYLKELIENNQVLGYRNFIETDLTKPYEGNSNNNDYHGTQVFKLIAGKKEEMQIGLATASKYYLSRTDESENEYRAEEDYWVAALEWMHSEGVRLINSSLGYSNGYNNSAENYRPEDVDGKSSAITRATEIAIKEKGMTIVISAGNDGNKSFKIISIPCDAEGVISVGSSGYRYWEKLDFSSIGPEHLTAVKPEISCYGAGGTSFSAPIITGLIACMREMKPEIDNNTIIDILEKSSHLYPFPNNYLGYGVPDARKVIKLLDNPNYDSDNSKVINSSNSYNLYLPKSYNIMAFHKKDRYIVQSQEKLRWHDGMVEIIRPANAQYTTVTNGEKVWEIIWKD